MTAQPSDAQDGYLAQFELLQGTQAGRAPAAVRQLRQDAIARFSHLGFPTPRMEEWRFTNVEPIASTAFAQADEDTGVTRAQLDPLTFAGLSGIQLVFLNGRFAPGLSSTGTLGAGVEVRSLGEMLARAPEAIEPHLARLAPYQHHAFSALNTALLQDGAFIRIPDNVVLDRPVHLVFGSTVPGECVATHPRVLVLLGENSSARIIENFASLRDAAYFTNAVTEVDVGPNSVVDHYKVIRESPLAYHVASLHLRLARSSVATSTSITLGGALVRNDVGVVLHGEGAECTLNGLYLASGQQLVDNHTTIDHAMPHCASHELYKGVLDGRGRAVFNGKIIVRIDAQKTDAKQTNKALLLSEHAQINTKPQLEIFADDVKCTHGATVGQLDADALFYLRARGLGLARARRVLIHAFANDVLQRIQLEPVRTRLEAALLDQLPVSAVEG